MRTDKHAEGAEEDGKILPALRVFLPGEAIPTPYAPAAERRFEPGRHPLDDPPLPPRRQVGRRIIRGEPGEWGSYWLNAPS